MIGSGFLCCNKPPGITSRQLVNVLSKRINAGKKKRERIKVGHTGTLDPLATGVLVLAVGSATRLTEYIGGYDKQYDGSFQMGIQSDSGDVDGTVTEGPSKSMPSEAQMESAIPNFVGTITQVPPIYSAIHIDGVRAYRLARQGKEVEMPERQVRIDALHLTRFDPPEFDLSMRCGGGTYVRTMGMDLAKAVGQTAVMTRLCRVAVGPYHLDDAIGEEAIRTEDLTRHVRPLASAVLGLPQLVVTPEQTTKLIQGQTIIGQRLLKPSLPRGIVFQPKSEIQGSIAAVSEEGNLVAILNISAIDPDSSDPDFNRPDGSESENSISNAPLVEGSKSLRFRPLKVFVDQIRRTTG